MRCKTGSHDKLTVVLSALVVFAVIALTVGGVSATIAANRGVGPSGEADYGCTGSEEAHQDRGDDREL